VARLACVEIVPESFERFAGLDRLAVHSANAARYDQGIARVLFEQFIGFDMQGVRGNVPDRLVDAHYLAAAFLRRSRVVELDQEDGPAVDRAHVNRAAEGNRQARLDVEPVERIDNVHVRIVRWPAGPPGQW